MTIHDGIHHLPLSCYKSHEAMNVVSVHESISESIKLQIISRTKKLGAWATTILKGHLDQKIFWQGLHTMIWPSLHYPLAVSTISESAAARNSKKFYKALLPKLGTNHLYPTPLHILLLPSLASAFLIYIGNKVLQLFDSFLKLALVTQLTATSFTAP